MMGTTCIHLALCAFRCLNVVIVYPDLPELFGLQVSQTLELLPPVRVPLTYQVAK